MMALEVHNVGDALWKQPTMANQGYDAVLRTRLSPQSKCQGRGLWETTADEQSESPPQTAVSLYSGPQLSRAFSGRLIRGGRE